MEALRGHRAHALARVCDACAAGRGPSAGRRCHSLSSRLPAPLPAEVSKQLASYPRLRFCPARAAPKYRNVLEKVAGVTRSVLGAMGFGQRMSDNAAINVVQLKVG